MEAESVENEVRLSVPHIAQAHSWDCGLACTQMVLRFCEKSYDDFSDAAKQCGFGESVWTIDLAVLLTRYAVRNCLTTIMLGVDKEYSKKSFYKNRFTVDQHRVDTLFQQASSLGLFVEERSVGIDEIVKHLVVHRQPLIVLTDCNLLHCLSCNPLKLNTSCSCWGQCLGRMGSYQGHFIVVCGYNLKDKVIYYQNPGLKSQALCCCSMQTFDKARRAHGTDEDILFIYGSDSCNALNCESNHDGALQTNDVTHSDVHILPAESLKECNS